MKWDALGCTLHWLPASNSCIRLMHLPPLLLPPPRPTHRWSTFGGWNTPRSREQSFFIHPQTQTYPVYASQSLFLVKLIIKVFQDLFYSSQAYLFWCLMKVIIFSHHPQPQQHHHIATMRRTPVQGQHGDHPRCEWYYRVLFWWFALTWFSDGATVTSTTPTIIYLITLTAVLIKGVTQSTIHALK